MKAELVLAAKDIRLLLRDRGGAFVTFVFPFIYCVFFGLILSDRDGDQRIEVVVVDEDASRCSQTFLRKLAETSQLNVAREDRTQAVELVRQGKKAAYIVLNEGFGPACDGFLLNKRPRIEIGMDPARKAESLMLSGLLDRCAFEMVAELFSDRRILHQRIDLAHREYAADGRIPLAQRDALDRLLDEISLYFSTLEESPQIGAEGENREDQIREGGWRPVEIATTGVSGIRIGADSGYDISFPQGVIWGVMGCCATFGISLVAERNTGTLTRLCVAPIGRASILAGKALACFLSTLGVAVLMFATGWVFFGVVPDSVWHLSVTLMLISTAFVGIMMFLSVLGKTERTVSAISWGVLLGMAMLGGGMVPRMFMPHWMQAFSNVSPVKWAILGMEGAVWRDFSTREMALSWFVLTGVGFGCFALAAGRLDPAEQN